MPRRKILTTYKPKPRYVPKVKNHEQSIQRRVCSYLKIQYPRILFRSDYASGLKLTMAQAVMHKSMQAGRSWPDLFIYAPRKVGGKQYAGMALELKREGTTIICKIGKNKGKLVADPHIQEQYYLLKELERLGYWADFGIGFEDSISKIDYYMGKPKNTELF